MNKVFLLGRLTKDVELRYTTSNIACATFDVAINNGKDKDGNDRKADFIRCNLWDKQAENMTKYTHKGSMVAVEGSVKNDSYEDENGNKHYRTYVLARRVMFLDSKRSEEPLPEPPEEYQGTPKEIYEEFGNLIQEQEDIPDNELPF